MASGRKRPGASKQLTAVKKDNYDQLARELFPEMNASLYSSSPSTYFRMRLASAALQLKPTADMLSTRYEMSYGVVSADWRIPDDDRVRVEYVALEVTVLLHHAAETLMRLYFAHVDAPNCPWLEVSRLTDFKRFKSKVDSVRRTKRGSWNRRRLASVFLGGTDPADSGLDISQTDFDEHVDATIVFLTEVSNRLLNESNLYNSAKHGLAGIVDSSTKMVMDIGGETHELNDGPCIAYPYRTVDPDSSTKDLKWRMSVDAIQIDSDMLIIEAVCKYIDSLFDVARRRYVGEPGAVWVCNRNYIYKTILQGRVAAAQLVSGYAFDLTTSVVGPDGERTLSGILAELSSIRISDSILSKLEAYTEESDSPRPYDLPEQERFRRVTVRNEHLLPFSPNGSQSQLANPSGGQRNLHRV